MSWRARRAWCRRGRCRGSDRPPSSLQTQHYFLLCFLLKFSLTVSSCLICFGFTLQSFCDSSRARNLTNCSSIMLSRWVLIPPPSPAPCPLSRGPEGAESTPCFGSHADTAPAWFDDFANGLLTAQKLTAALTVLHTGERLPGRGPVAAGGAPRVQGLGRWEV